MKFTMRIIAASAVALVSYASFAGWNEYTKTINGSIADITLTVNDTAISHTLSGDGIDTLRFTRSSDFYSVKLRSSSGNDLSGGIIVDGFLLKVQNPNVLGTGPVMLTNNWSGLYVDWQAEGSAVDVTNKVVFDTVNSFAAGQDAYKLILHNVGVTDANSGKVVTLGREKTGTANVTLSLDGSDNDAIGYFSLRGNLALDIDGGTISASATGGTRDIFQKVDSDATPTITVHNSPLTIDVADGGDVSLGVSPVYSKDHTATSVVEEYKTSDWSFEDGPGSWTVSNGGVYEKGAAAFDGAGQTTNGTKYVMVRQGATLSRTISLPSDGLWRVVLEQGCRSGGYSLNMATTVSIGGSTVLTIPAVTTAHGFQEYSSDLVQLSAGDYAFQIAVASGGTYNSLNFDAIRFERVEETTPGFSIAKTGAGSLTLTGDDFPSTTSELGLSVYDGTLVVASAELDGNSIAVANGGEVVFSAVAATDAVVGVAAGGKVTFGQPATELVTNGGFETPVVTSYGFQWSSACSWTLKPDGSSEERNNAGIQHNGSAVTADSDDQTPYGDQSLYLRPGGSASQSVTVPEDGDYTLYFWQAARNYGSAHELDLTVYVDGTSVHVNSGRSARYAPYLTRKTLTLTQGSHTLKFECGSGGADGAMVFVDAISLKAVASPNDFSAARLSFESGATVELNDVSVRRFKVGEVLVDGVKVLGGNAALEAAGVTIIGDGRISCGNYGMRISIR